MNRAHVALLVLHFEIDGLGRADRDMREIADGSPCPEVLAVEPVARGERALGADDVPGADGHFRAGCALLHLYERRDGVDGERDLGRGRVLGLGGADDARGDEEGVTSLEE